LGPSPVLASLVLEKSKGERKVIAVTISVTKSPLLLEQIHFIAIQNITPDDRNAIHTYAVTLDGEDSGAVLHDPTHGALVLVERATRAITDDLEKRARRLVELVEEGYDE
jgi:hypothetical protein